MMIEFNYETEYTLPHPEAYRTWVTKIITSENFEPGDINYIFCDDRYLHRLNVEYLNHDTLTDIISFDYTEGRRIAGDIFISLERVKENATLYDNTFEEELRRVMAHGILHYCGYKDKSETDQQKMRTKEDEKLLLFHVEHY